MPKTTQSNTLQTQSLQRTDALKQGLLEHQRQLQNTIHNRVRDGRARGTQEGADDLEHSEADIQNDLALALLQMQSEALVQIDAALARLEAGTYGSCVQCDHEIATGRLRALPFTVRCQVCAAKREAAAGDARRLAQSRGGSVRFPEMARG
jgi:RNA polymerase-binding transcription factor DksA